MTNELMHWLRFRDQAMAQVNGSKFRKRNRDYIEECILQILDEPSFDSISAVKIYRLDHNSDSTTSFCCVKTIWHQMADQRYFSSPLEYIKAMRLEQLGMLSPTIEYVELELNIDFGIGIQERLRALRLPLPSAPSGVGLDGETWTVRFGDYMKGVEYNWWCNCPGKWLLLGDVVNDIWSMTLKI